MAILISCATAAFAGRSITLDAGFPYYKDRSAESIAEELKVNGFDDVRLVCASESGISDELVKALKDAGMSVWMMTWVNGTYSTADLPKGWESWRMKLRKPATPDGFIYLCMNSPSYREWKKRRVVAALNAHPFMGIDLVEPFFPAYLGPQSEQYGCLCDSCRRAFRTAYSSDPPDFENPKSPHYWKTDTTLYEKWVGFRVASVVSFIDDLVNGKGGIREKCPLVKVATWSLGLDVPDQLSKLREWEAIDAAAIVKRVKPDLHVIQTDWPDWLKPDLSSKYPLKYKPVADSVRDASPGMALMLQADIGSKTTMRRSRAWLDEVEKAAKDIHCQSVTSYEYHIGDYIYTEPPALVRAVWEQDIVKLIFNKRLDTISASNLANYTISSGKIDYAKVDGNIVRLSISGTDSSVTVVVSGLSDDETRRLFHDKPACAMEKSAQITVERSGMSPGDASSGSDGAGAAN